MSWKTAQQANYRPVFPGGWNTEYEHTSRVLLDEPKPPSTLSSDYLPLLSGNLGLVHKARIVVLNLPEGYPAKKAEEFLGNLQQTLDLFQRVRLDLTNLPQISAYAADDGSVLFDWVLSGCRLGFSIERDPEESSWYLVTDRARGAINASGLLSGVNLKVLLPWLLLFVAARS